MDRLDEKARRRDPFAGGVPVVLGDGQEWSLPRPRIGFYPGVGEDGSLRFGEQPESVFGRDYDALLDAYVEAEDGSAAIRSLLSLAVDLLRRNYDLPPADLRTLLPRFYDDDGNTEMWRAVADVAVGRSPKPTPVG